MFLFENGLKQGNALQPFLFGFTRICHYAGLGKPEGLQIKWYHHFLVYADVKVQDESVHTVKENRESIVVVSEETGLEVNGDKAKYKVVQI